MMRSGRSKVQTARGLLVTMAVACLAGSSLAQSPEAKPAAASPTGMNESVAAVVNDEIISTFDLSQRMRLMIATSGVQPTAENLQQFQREALVGLVDERIQLHELRRVAKEQKIDLIISDEEVTQEVSDMARQNNLSANQFTDQLASQGIGPDTLRQQIRAQVSWQRWIRGRYGSRLRIGEDQIKAQMQHIAASATKAQFQISEVFLDANRVGGMDVAVNGANQLVAQLQQGAPFAAVARQFSGSASAASGGEVGWISQGEMPAEVDTALEQMRPGQLSKPIAVHDGVYIVFLRDKRSGANASIVHIKQAAVALPQTAPQAVLDAARTQLMALRGQITGCDDLETKAATVPGVIAGDLGEAEIKDLAPDFRAVAERLQPGQISEPIRTIAGLHILAICQKSSAGEQAASHDQIESRLYGQQLSMISRRYMRDLRNSATVETR